MYNTLLVFLISSTLLFDKSHGAGAGRAVPVDSENFAITTFQRVNPRIEWDPTNFLIDLSGQFANCNYLNQKGEIRTDRKTPEGASVRVFVDSIEGKNSDVNSVNEYVKQVVKRWVDSRLYDHQITDAKRVGCSIRPSCSGYAVVACVFSSGIVDKVPPPILFTTRRPLPTPTTVWKQWEQEKGLGDEKPKALAFTRQQYDVAERIMHKKWDKEHFLENLSGYETQCDMVGRRDWPFEYKTKIEKQLNLRLIGLYGNSPNKGNTQEAMEALLGQFKPIGHSNKIGCSLIPDCRMRDGSMQVVVACLFEEE